MIVSMSAPCLAFKTWESMDPNARNSAARDQIPLHRSRSAFFPCKTSSRTSSRTASRTSSIAIC